jgi:hypothetical protein
MSFATTVLANFPDATPTTRNALLAAITAAQASQDAAAPATKPAKSAKSTTPTTTVPRDRFNAKASEGASAAEDEVLAEFEGLDGSSILAALSQRLVLVEGLELSEAMLAAARRYPKVAERYFAEVSDA